MDWNPELYRRFKAHRFLPFADLLKLVAPRPSGSVVDLGCGAGEGTARLANQMPGCTILGIDTSPAMLEAAKPLVTTTLRFEHGDITSVDGSWDVIFSNAALQWVPDHPKLLADLWGRLNAGGRIAVQLPANHNYFANHLREEIAKESPFKEALTDFKLNIPVLPLDEYARVLHDLGAEELQVFEKIFPAVLADSDAVFTWLQATTLRPYWQHLPESLHEAFADRIKTRLHAHYGPGEVFFPYRRIFFAGTKRTK